MDSMRLEMRARPPIRRKQLSARNKHALYKHEESTRARAGGAKQEKCTAPHRMDSLSPA